MLQAQHMAGAALGFQEAPNSGHTSCPLSLHLGWLVRGLEGDAPRLISKAQSLKESIRLA